MLPYLILKETRFLLCPFIQCLPITKKYLRSETEYLAFILSVLSIDLTSQCQQVCSTIMFVQPAYEIIKSNSCT